MEKWRGEKELRAAVERESLKRSFQVAVLCPAPFLRPFCRCNEHAVFAVLLFTHVGRLAGLVLKDLNHYIMGLESVQLGRLMMATRVCAHTQLSGENVLT